MSLTLVPTLQPLDSRQQKLQDWKKQYGDEASLYLTINFLLIVSMISGHSTVLAQKGSDWILAFFIQKIGVMNFNAI